MSCKGRSLQTYDPEGGPSAAEWLAIDEAERIALVEAAVIDALARLRAEGLTRHNAVHAVGTVLAAHIYELLKAPPVQTWDPNGPYLRRLRRLTATEWLRSGS